MSFKMNFTWREIRRALGKQIQRMIDEWRGMKSKMERKRILINAVIVVLFVVFVYILTNGWNPRGWFL